MNQVLVDSNLFTYGIGHYSDDVADIFTELAADKLELAVSAYTGYEVYRGLALDRIATTNALLKVFTRADVDQATFRLAAVLTTCYNVRVSTKDHSKSYDDGDVILAASAFRLRAYILTANVNDFPRPFFTEHKAYAISHKRKRNTIHIGLLCPNVNAFQTAINECYPGPLRSSGDSAT